MFRKSSIILVALLGLVFLLTACGEKSQEAVVKKLENKLGEMNGYKVKAEMNMNTGEKEQSYNIDVWHKKKEFYRVALSSKQDEKGNQIILKNEDGVFVLTPALNKSFKFQTEWPENSSQPYLFQSLVHDIVKDKDASFKVTDSHYVFQTKTNYQSNNNLPYQEIYIDKKSYTPVLVKVKDKDKNALVEVKFSNFDMNPSFKEKDFVLEDNMTNSVADLPVSSSVDEQPFSVVLPSFTAGAELKEKKEIDLENGKRVIMSFAGEKNFTILQEKMDVMPTLSSPQEVKGDIVNLGYAVGAMTNNTIEWQHNGMNFYLASEELTKEELIEVAQSVAAKEVK
ncbi:MULTISPECIES: outer membrane lipoprotein carrier protein LolA [unclassified Virgibacillus]|uniref:LolA family protein n=1 Tax=unclassified Virgibacillus TaxID=2620237 RepID=UPI0024DE104B|nr:outer membrane lipoprotein carrier protein LolA [Virgibacillus sp. LDC-1]